MMRRREGRPPSLPPRRARAERGLPPGDFPSPGGETSSGSRCATMASGCRRTTGRAARAASGSSASASACARSAGRSRSPRDRAAAPACAPACRCRARAAAHRRRAGSRLISRNERRGAAGWPPPFEPRAIRRRSEGRWRWRGGPSGRGLARRAGGASCIRARCSHVKSPGTMRTSVARLPSRLALCGLLAGRTVARPAAGATSPTVALHVERARQVRGRCDV